MLKLVLMFFLFVLLSAEVTTKPIRLRSQRVIPTNNNNPYSGYANPPGYNPNQGISYNTGASNGYPYGGPNPNGQPPPRQQGGTGGVYPNPYPYGPTDPNAQAGANGMHHTQVGMPTTPTGGQTAPKAVKKMHHPGTGIYLVLFLFLPCLLTGCCIGRMFWSPKAGLLHYPDPMEFEDQYHDPLGEYHAAAGPYPDQTRSFSQQPRSYSQQPPMRRNNPYAPPQRSASGRLMGDPNQARSHSLHDSRRLPPHLDQQPYRDPTSPGPYANYDGAHLPMETPYDPVYDYGGTPQNTSTKRMDPLKFLQKLV